MNRRTKYIVLIFSLVVCLPIGLFSQSFAVNGQLSSFHLSSFTPSWSSVNGIRYFPEIKGLVPIHSTWKLDVEASVNIYGHVDIQTDTCNEFATLKPYRCWGRLATDRFELRLGLQKINFGSATMLRPLMWFDRLDPRDPLQLTDGVYGALGRYFFQNNANVWIWSVWPGHTVKGWELLTSDHHRPEFGGRFQMPAGKGEIAISGHFRYEGTDQVNGYYPVELERPVPEYRLGLDGKWDIGPGVWFEGSYTYHELPVLDIRHIRMLTLGADYTFDIGNGVTSMAEQFVYQTGPSMFKNASDLTFSALSVTYPANLIHAFSMMVFYNWRENDWYRFINWKISLDKISFHLIVFWNPDHFDIYQNTGESNLMGGKGVQLMFVWNH